MRVTSWTVLHVVGLLVLWLSNAHGQELLRPERNEMGTLINQDYYTVDQHPETIALLRIVEHVHFNQQVFENFRAGYYKLVIGDLKYTLERLPNHPGALSLLSTVASVTKVNNLPIPAYEKALALYPQYAYTHAQYGYYLSEVGAMEKAVEHFKEAIRLDGQLASAHAWLAEAYYKQGKVEAGKREEEIAKKLGYTRTINRGEPQSVVPATKDPAKAGKKQKGHSSMQLSLSDEQ